MLSNDKNLKNDPLAIRIAIIPALLTGTLCFLAFFPELASGEILSEAASLRVGGGRLLTLGAFGLGVFGLLSTWVRRSYAVTKKAFDVVAAFLGLVLSLPIMAFFAILIKLSSPGPIFYRQKRLGKDGEPFYIYKLRTMGDGAEQVSGPVWAGDDDPRITPIGRFMRRRRIDEIPQFLNVLRGEMSLVGPRPERPYFSARITEVAPNFPKRLSVKPGITGLAQVRYRYGASIRDARRKLRYDLIYCRRFCFLLDLRVLVSTVGCVLKGAGAR